MSDGTERKRKQAVEFRTKKQLYAEWYGKHERASREIPYQMVFYDGWYGKVTYILYQK